MSTQPIEQRWRPNLEGVVPFEAEHAIRLIFDGIQDHDDAIVALNTKVAALQTTPSTTTTTTSTTSGGSTPSVPTVPYLGVVNNQTGVTAYTLQSTDNGALVVLNDASAIALSLNSVVTAPFFATITNEGTGVVTMTPTSGTITSPGNIAGASLAVPSGYSALAFFDGTNWWAILIPGTLGASGTITIPKLTTANGSITVVNGLITAFTNPT